ncbi:hypothetical protein Tco_0407033 [Tanacetum coccineum]
MAIHVMHQSEDPATMILLSKSAAEVAVDPVSTAYLNYRIPYVPLGLRILEEERRGKDTSLTHLKVFGCDSFVKVKDVCVEAMKCTFIGSGSDEMRYNFRDMKGHRVIQSRDITFVDSIYGARFATDSSSLTKPILKSQVVLVDIPKNLAENDSIVAEHGLSSEITQSPVRAQIRVRGPKTVGASRIVEDQMKKTLKTEHPPRREAPRLYRYEDPPESSWIVLIFIEDSWNEEPCSDVHQVGDKIEVKVLHSFNWPPSELTTEDGVLPKRGAIYRTESARADMMNSQNLMSTRIDLMRTTAEKEEFLRSYRAM